MQVHFDKAVYSCRLIEKKVCIHMHALSQEEKCVWVGNQENSRLRNTKGQYHGISPQY